MDDYYFTYCTFGVNSISVDIYEILRPSLVCDGMFLAKLHTRFDKRAIDDDDISIINCRQEYVTGDFNKNGTFRIPNTHNGKHKWFHLFSFYEIGPDYSGNACNPELSITLYKPIIKFIRYMENSN